MRLCLALLVLNCVRIVTAVTTTEPLITTTVPTIALLTSTCKGTIYQDENLNQIQDVARKPPKHGPKRYLQERVVESFVPGVVVVITDNMGISRSGITDANGQWSIGGVFSGPATLEVIIPAGFFITTPPNPRNIIVPSGGGVHYPTQGGIGINRIEEPISHISEGDTAPLIVGGVILAILLLTCCCCFWCQLPSSTHHVHREYLPLHQARANIYVTQPIQDTVLVSTHKGSSSAMETLVLPDSWQTGNRKRK